MEMTPQLVFEALGTQVRCYFDAAPEIHKHLCDEIVAEMTRIDETYSRFRSGNILENVNSHIGEWQVISSELTLLLKHALEAYHLTDGAFDIRVKSALEGLGYDANYSLQAHEDYDAQKFTDEIEGVPPLMLEDSRLKIQSEIELGGLGKGYAIDRMKEVFEKYQVRNFCINAGGDIFANGVRKDGRSWKIYFENPFASDEVIGEIAVGGFAVATSGTTQRSWGAIHHLIDPRTGTSARETASTIVTASSAIIADIYSTALFVMGFEKAQRWYERMVVVGKTPPINFAIISIAGSRFQTQSFSGSFY